MSNPQSSESLLRQGENCCAIAGAGRFAVLIDGADYFEAFRRAAERAQRSILILAWDFNSQAPLTADGLLAGDFLNSLARRRRGLHIRILDWDFPLIFQHDREIPPTLGLGFKAHRRVDFRYDAAGPLGASHHQKIVVVDDAVAFVGGMDIAARRWDTPEHRPGDPRRVASGAPYPPVHDAMVVFDGDAARAVAKIARARWEKATGETLSAVRAASDPWPEGLAPELTDVRIGVACTEPAAKDGKDVREIERLYLDMIARARKYMYIENQYFTSHTIGEALAARLAEPDGPEIVVVTRELSHGWLEEVTMSALRTRLVRDLRKADRHGHLHVYCGHVDGLQPGTCLDVHSKVMIVDDEWLRVGSANVSNRSMGLDSECDVVVEARGDKRVATAIRAVRDRLLAEHLGSRPDEVAAAVERAGSLHGAIETVTGPRSLCPLGEQPEWSEAALAVVAVADPEQPVSLEKLVQELTPGVPARPAFLTWRRGLIVAAVLLILTVAWRFTPLASVVRAEAIAAHAEAMGTHPWAAPLLILAYVPASLIALPRPLLTVAGVLAFGPWGGFGCAVAGNLLAALATYGLGRMLRPDQVRAFAGARLHALSLAFRKRGFLAITALRLVPAAPFVVENVVAGAIRIPLGDYLLATFLGMLPGEIASALFGRELQQALASSSTGQYVWIYGLVLVMALAAFLMHRYVLAPRPRRLTLESSRR